MSMFLRLKIDHKEMPYRITKLEITQNHKTSVGEFKHYSTARRMGGSEKDSNKAFVDLNIETKSIKAFVRELTVKAIQTQRT